jgi:hypothetical protein
MHSRERIRTKQEKPMTDSELDAVYTQLCKTMTELGEAHAPLYLARFALLAIDRISDAQAAMRLVADARDGITDLASPPPEQ